MTLEAVNKMEIQNFHIAGINYKKTDVAIRGKFAINEAQYESLVLKAKTLKIKNLFVLSTCNRTEIYGISASVTQLTNLLCSETEGSFQDFETRCYIKSGQEAVEHLFDVSSGMDSQILGDYEIVGQLKNAVKFAKKNGTIGTFSERLVNTVFESSKAIKNKTMFSGGTVSVAFAAIQFLRLHCTQLESKKIVLIGTGKIGKNTCKNLIDYLHATNITLINRSNEKAEYLALELNVGFANYADYQQQAFDADIVIVATNAAQPILAQQHFDAKKQKVLIDLSIPNNIAPEVKTLANTILVNVDDLSKMNDATLKMREQEIPKVKNIIEEHIEEFYEWYKMRKNAPIIRAAKKTLTDIHLCPWFQAQQAGTVETEEQQAVAIQKAVKQLAVKIRTQQQTPGCSYIETLHDFIADHHSLKQ